MVVLPKEKMLTKRREQTFVLIMILKLSTTKKSENSTYKALKENNNYGVRLGLAKRIISIQTNNPRYNRITDRLCDRATQTGTNMY